MNVSLDDEMSAQYNQFIQNYNEKASCGTECQQAKDASQLQQDYLSAVSNLNTAPEQVQSTYKSYLTYTQGTGAYQKYQQNNFQQTVDGLANTYQTNFNSGLISAKQLLGTYSSLYANYNNIFDLNKIYKKENIQLKKEVTNNDDDVVTNDRKTYYETQAIDSLKKYYWILTIIYTFVVIYFLFCMITKNSTYTLKVKIPILVFLIIYPFISLGLSLKIIEIYRAIISVFPTNQYKTL